MDIPFVEVSLFFVRYLFAAIDLSPPGNARADHQAYSWIGRLVLGHEGSGSNQRHFASKDIQPGELVHVLRRQANANANSAKAGF